MGVLAATGALMAITETLAHDVLEAAFLGRELRLELAKGGCFARTNYLAQDPKCRKGIITEKRAIAYWY